MLYATYLFNIVITNRFLYKYFNSIGHNIMFNFDNINNINNLYIIKAMTYSMNHNELYN